MRYAKLCFQRFLGITTLSAVLIIGSFASDNLKEIIEIKKSPEKKKVQLVLDLDDISENDQELLVAFIKKKNIPTSFQMGDPINNNRKVDELISQKAQSLLDILIQKEDNYEKYYRIITFSGGGLRGLIEAMIMAHIEKVLGKQIYECVHALGGTSTGAIIAVGLAMKYPAQDIVDLYMNDGPKIFGKLVWGSFWGVRYSSFDPQPLEDILKEKFKDTKLSNCVVDTTIMTYNATKQEPEIFNSCDAKNNEEKDIDLKTLLRLSTAAPNYFKLPVYKGCAYADGGLGANYPDLATLFKFIHRYKIHPHQIMTLGIGTGYSQKGVDPKKTDLGLVEAADLCLNALTQSTITQEYCFLFQEILGKLGFDIKRFSILFKLDDTLLSLSDPKILVPLKKFSEELIKKEESLLNDVVQILKKTKRDLPKTITLMNELSVEEILNNESILVHPNQKEEDSKESNEDIVTLEQESLVKSLNTEDSEKGELQQDKKSENNGITIVKEEEKKESSEDDYII